MFHFQLSEGSGLVNNREIAVLFENIATLLPDHLDNLFFGVGVARRAGLRREDVLNTFTLSKLMRSFKRQ